MENKLNFCYGIASLDNGKLEKRILEMLRQMDSCKSLKGLDVYILAQNWSDESVNSLENIKSGLENIEIFIKYIDKSEIPTFPSLRTGVADFVYASSNYDFVYITDDDYLFSGDYTEWINKCYESTQIMIKSNGLIPVTNFTAKNHKANILFPFRIGNQRGRLWNIKALTGINEYVDFRNNWTHVRNLEDISMHIMLIEYGYLPLIQHVSPAPKTNEKDNNEISITRNQSGGAFGVKLMQRLNEFYVIIYNREMLRGRFRELVDKNDVLLTKLGLIIDSTTDTNRDGGPYNPKDKHFKIIEEAKTISESSGRNWKYEALDLLYKTWGIL